MHCNEYCIDAVSVVMYRICRNVLLLEAAGFCRVRGGSNSSTCDERCFATAREQK